MADAQILLDLVISTEKTAGEVDQLIDNFEQLSRQIKQVENLGPGLRKSLDDNIRKASGNTKTLNDVVVDLNTNLDNTNKALAGTNNEFDKFSNQINSVDNLKKRLKELKKELEGINPKNKSRIDSITKEMAQLEQQIEDTNKDLGLLTGGLNSLDKAAKSNSLLNGSLARTARGFLTSFALFEVITATSDALRSVITVGAEFERQLSAVGAVANATAQELKLLEAESRRLGETTTFTAAQALEAAETLAIAGFTAREILGVQEGVLRLAEATSVSLEEAADVAAIVLRSFGLEVESITEVNNVLTNTITTANLRIDSFVEAFKLAGPVAKQVGLDLETTAAAIGTLADAGFRGSVGGTALRASLIRLTRPVGQAKEVLNELQIPLDTLANNGDFIGFLETLIERGATTEQVFGLFGKQSAAISVLINKLQQDTEGGSNAFRNYALRVGEVGTQVRGALDILPSLTGNIDDIVRVIGQDIVSDDGGLGALPIALEDSAAAVATLNSQFDETEDAITAFEDLIATLQEAAADESIDLELNVNTQGEIQDVFTALQDGTQEGIFDASQQVIVDDLFTNITSNTVELEESLNRLGIEYEEGATSIENYQNALNAYNTATDIATERNDNLTGDFIKLQSAVSETAISIFDSLAPTLRSLVQGVTETVQEINEAIRAFGSFRDFLIRNERIIKGLTTTIVAGATAWGLYRGAILATVLASRGLAVITGLTRGFVAVQGAVTALTTGTISLSRAFKVLRASLLATPLGAVLVGVTALTAGIVAFASETSSATEALNEFNDATADVGTDFEANVDKFTDRLTEVGRFNTTFERRQEILNELQADLGGYLDGIELEANSLADLELLYTQVTEAIANRTVDDATREQVDRYRTEVGVLRQVTEVIGDAAEAQREFDRLRAVESRSSSFSATLSADVEEARASLQEQEQLIERQLSSLLRQLRESGSSLTNEFEELLNRNLASLEDFSAAQLETATTNLSDIQRRNADLADEIIQEINQKNQDIIDEFNDTPINLANEVVRQISESQINIQEVTQEELRTFIRTLRSSGAETITDILQTITEQDDLVLQQFRESLGTQNIERIFTELEARAQIRIGQLEQTQESAAKASTARRKAQEREAEESNKRLNQLIAEADKLIEENDKNTLAGILRIRQRRLDSLVDDEAFAKLLSSSPERAAALIQGIEREIDTLRESLVDKQQEIFEETLKQSIQITADANESITNDLRQALISQFQQIETALDESEISSSEATRRREQVLQRFQEITRVNEEGQLEVVEEFRNRRLEVERESLSLLVDLRQDQFGDEEENIFRFVDLKDEELNVVRQIQLTREELEKGQTERLQRQLDERNELYQLEVVRLTKAYQQLIDSTEDGSQERQNLLEQQNDALLKIERDYIEELKEVREEAGVLNFRRVLAIDVNDLDNALETVDQYQEELLGDLARATAAGTLTAEQFAERRITIETTVETTVQRIRTRLEEDSAKRVEKLREDALRTKVLVNKELNNIRQDFVDEEESRTSVGKLLDAFFDLSTKRRERFEIQQQQRVLESERIQLEARRKSVQEQISLQADLIKVEESRGRSADDARKELLKLQGELNKIDEGITNNAAGALRAQAEEIKRAAELLKDALQGVFEGLSAQFDAELKVIEARIESIESLSDKRIEKIEKEAEVRELNIVAIGLEGEAQERANAKSELIKLGAISREERARDEQLAKENAQRQKIEKTQERIAAIQQTAAAAEQVANAIQLAQESGILAVKSAQAVANAGGTAGNPILAVIAIFAMVAALTSAFLAIRNAVKSFSKDASSDVPSVPTFADGGLNSGDDASQGGKIKGYRHSNKKKRGTWLLAEKDEYINNRESVSMFYPVLDWVNQQGLKKRKGQRYESTLPMSFFSNKGSVSTVHVLPKVPRLTTRSIAQDGGLVGGELNNSTAIKEQREQTSVLRDILDATEDNRQAIENIKLQISRSELQSLEQQANIEDQRRST